MGDTEWIDILEKKGIIKKTHASKEDEEKESAGLLVDDEKRRPNFDELEDDDDELDKLGEEDEKAFNEYRQKRLAELRLQEMKPRFGDVLEITRQDYVDQVNKAGEGVWVVLHVYQEGNTLCALINQFMNELARKFPNTKFIRSLVSLCIPNFPEGNLPAIFVYLENDLKKQILGSLSFGGTKLKLDEFEWMIAETGAIKTDLESDPRKKAIKASKHYTSFGVDHDSDEDDD